MFECTQIICKVDNIAQAVADYTALGFSVEWGAEPKKAHNAFLWFEGGPNIELFQVPSYVKALRLPIRLAFGKQVKSRFLYWHGVTQGMASITVSPSNKEEQLNLKSVYPALGKAGISTSRIIKGSRKKPDGEKVSYSFAVPMSDGLPLIASVYDPPQHPATVSHVNGAKSVAWIKIAVSSEDWQQFQFLTDHDDRVELKPASETKILAVGLAGLNTELDSKKLHGAALHCA